MAGLTEILQERFAQITRLETICIGIRWYTVLELNV